MSHPVQITIGATLAASLGSTVRGAQTQLNRLGSTMADLGNKKLGVAQLEGLRSQAADVAKAWLAAQRKVNALQAKAGAAPTVRQTRALERARIAADKAGEAYKRQRKAADDLTKSLRKQGVNTDRLTDETVRLGSAMDLLRKRTSALGRAQDAVQRNLEKRAGYRAQLVDAAALGAALYGLMKPAIAFESVMADVKKVVDFETPTQFQEMGKGVLELSTRIPMAAEGLGQIVAAAGQAGIAREELLRFAEDAAKMGVAFDMSGDQAGAAMTGLRNVFKLTQDQTVSLGDAINQLANNMDAKAADMLRIASRAGSTARLIGLSGQQFSALGATFLELKTAPEVAATGINALLMKMSTADKQGEKFEGALNRIGLSGEFVKRKMGEDAQGAILMVLESLKGSKDLMGDLSDLFGMEYSDDMAKLVGGLDTYRKSLGLVADEQAYAGSMQREYEARAATTANNLQLLGNNVMRLGVTVGGALLPAFNALVGAAMGPIGALSELAARFPLVTQVVVGLVAGLIALKVATIGLGYAWTFIKGPFLTGRVLFQSVRAGLALLQAQAMATGGAASVLGTGWNKLRTGAVGLFAPLKAAALGFWSMLPAIGATAAALLANPITWIVIGITAAVAGLAYAVYKYWDPLSDFIGGLWSGITATVGKAIDWIGAKIGWIVKTGQKVGQWFGSIFGNGESGEQPKVSPGGGVTAPTIPTTVSTLLQPQASTQSVANKAATTNNSVSITVNAPGLSAREVAVLIEERLRALLRETQNNTAALYD
jgi:TP901 family phage tail tape measure protein